MGNKFIKLDCLNYGKNRINEDGTYQIALKKGKSTTQETIKKLEKAKENSDNNKYNNNKKEDSNSFVRYPPNLQRRKGVKVLFLDVDGVLNTKYTKWCDRTKGIEDNLLKYLKIILDKTECKIVLTTSWRLYREWKLILLHELKTRADINICDVLIGETPHISNVNRRWDI